MRRTILLSCLLLPIHAVNSNCVIVGTSGALNDPLYAVLQSALTCPSDVFSLRESIYQKGLTLKTAMVANRGFHNPLLGSFSLFESATGRLSSEMLVNPGEFFFGYFTKIEENVLIADQDPLKKALLVEAIAWDYSKNVYNFYELKGNGRKGKWYYRGDSADIFADNKYLHRTATEKPVKFGKRLRCSGCHGNGGPIMKELSYPYNDWWMDERPLDFGNVAIEARLQSILNNVESANNFAQDVRKGIAHLLKIPATVTRQLSLQERLRPLFCPVEINLVADTAANERQSDIFIPSEFLIDPLLLKPKTNIRYPRLLYNQQLLATGTHFPETDFLDADHPWLTPVKSEADHQAIKKLLAEGIVDKKFVVDILGFDFSNPTFSDLRCAFLQLIPEYSENWQHRFMNRLRYSRLPGAINLYRDMQNPNSIQEIEIAIKNYYQRCEDDLLKYDSYVYFYQIMLQRRQELRESAISKNPLGQILEPVFRVIFPTHTFKVGNIFLGNDCSFYWTREERLAQFSKN